MKSNKLEQIEAYKYVIHLQLNDAFNKNDIELFSNINYENKDDIKDLYATQERIDKWKEDLIQKIKDCKNPFDINIGYYTEKYIKPTNKVFKAPKKFINRTKNVAIDKVYVLGEEMYDYHKGITDTSYYYYVLYDNKLSRITYNEFCDILKLHGYNDVKQYRYHYQIDIFETKWKEDYPKNYRIVDGYDYKVNDLKVVRKIFGI